MCGFNSGYHDVNVCYHGRTKFNFNTTQSEKNNRLPYVYVGGAHEKKVGNQWPITSLLGSQVDYFRSRCVQFYVNNTRCSPSLSDITSARYAV